MSDLDYFEDEFLRIQDTMRFVDSSNHHHFVFEEKIFVGFTFVQSSFRVANPRSYLLDIGPNDTFLRASSIHGMKRGFETLLQVLATWQKNTSLVVVGYIGDEILPSYVGIISKIINFGCRS